MTARQLVMFVQRPGGQSQFSAQLGAQVAARDPLRDLQAWIAEHPDEDHSVERLAARVAMSPRHFARVFRDEVGSTPAAYVESVRVEVARRLLETDRLERRSTSPAPPGSGRRRPCAGRSRGGSAPARSSTGTASARKRPARSARFERE